MNQDGFFKRWINGMKNLDAKDTTRAKISLHVGNLIGYGGGILTMGYFAIVLKNYQWWWTILILIVAFLVSIIEFNAAKQQLKMLESSEDVLKQLESTRL